MTIRLFCWAMFFFISLNSCITKKQFDLLQATSENKSAEYDSPKAVSYRLEVGDFLFVKHNLPSWSNDMKSLGSSAISQGEVGRKFEEQYPVTEDGVVILPEVGAVPVVGKTIVEAQKTIRGVYQQTYKEIEVRVELAYFNFVVLGEVNKQGQFETMKRQLTILEAVGMAGGLTPLADRTKIQLVRRKGVVSKVYDFSLTDRSILESEIYFVRPNDVITVDRMKESFQNMGSSPWFSNVQLTLSIMSSLLVFVLLFQK